MSLPSLCCYLCFNYPLYFSQIALESNSPFFLALSLCEGDVEVLSDLVDELEGVEVLVTGGGVGVVHDDGQIFGHVAVLDGLNDHALKSLAEVLKLGVAVDLGTVEKTTGPGVHGCDRVGRGLTTLLVDAVMAGHGTVSSLRLD